VSRLLFGLPLGATDENGVMAGDLRCVRADESGVESEYQVGGRLNVALPMECADMLETLGDAGGAISDRGVRGTRVERKDTREYIGYDAIEEVCGEPGADRVLLGRRPCQHRQ